MEIGILQLMILPNDDPLRGTGDLKMQTLLVALYLIAGMFTHSAGSAIPDTVLMLDWATEEGFSPALYEFADGIVCDLLTLDNNCETGDNIRAATLR